MIQISNSVLRFLSSSLSSFLSSSFPPPLSVFTPSPKSWLWSLCWGRWLLKLHSEYYLSTLATYVERDKLSCLFWWESPNMAHISFSESSTFPDCEDFEGQSTQTAHFIKNSPENMISVQIPDLFSPSSHSFTYILLPFFSLFPLSSRMVSTSGVQEKFI